MSRCLGEGKETLWITRSKGLGEGKETTSINCTSPSKETKQMQH